MPKFRTCSPESAVGDQLVSLAFCLHTISCCACFGLPPQIRTESLLRVGHDKGSGLMRSADLCRKMATHGGLRSTRRPETAHTLCPVKATSAAIIKTAGKFIVVYPTPLVVVRMSVDTISSTFSESSEDTHTHTHVVLVFI